MLLNSTDNKLSALVVKPHWFLLILALLRMTEKIPSNVSVLFMEFDRLYELKSVVVNR